MHYGKQGTPRDQPIFSKADLILRYYRGELNAEESEQLEQWLAEDVSNQQFAEKLQDEVFLQDQLDFFSSIDSEVAWQKVAGQIDKPKPNFWQNAPYLKYAAVILVLCLTGSLVYKYQGSAPRSPVEVVQNNTKALPVKKVPAISNQVQLALANGTLINLDNLTNGIIWNKNGIRITKHDQEITFISNPETNIAKNTGRHSLTVPTGRQYKITLPDGSQVWLNAASSLSFANNYQSKNREVLLTGEAYLEVAKDKNKPFVVQAQNSRVEVLGTHFNVMAYPEELSVNTTLLEGSVKISHDNQHRIIKPGYQAKVGKSIAVEKVNVNAAVAWKNGLFHFQNTELEVIMRQLERWYGVDFVNRKQLRNQHFTGIISRQTEIAKILKMLELSGDMRFQTEGQKVIIQSDK
ncbi:FecR family protein [Adhaeribacter pallidiroseus]|nr:FecR family protein [Adhaeribacter pallidiroseus]